MTQWNFTPAPQTGWIIAALPNCERVGKTHWLPEQERWEGMAKGQEPVAWVLWPEHPHKEKVDD